TAHAWGQHYLHPHVKGWGGARKFLLALLPYVPRLAPGAMPGKVTATTFVLERPCCIFDPLANASDAVWLAVAFADAAITFKNPTSRAEVPPYEGLPTARAYMTLEMAAAAYGCSAPSAAVLRVGGDTMCHGRAPCNGPLPSPGPYRQFFSYTGGFAVFWKWGGVVSAVFELHGPCLMPHHLFLQHPGVRPTVLLGPGHPPALQDPPRPSSPAPHAAPHLHLWLHAAAPWPMAHQVKSLPSLIASFVVFQPNHQNMAWTCWVCHPRRPPGSIWRGSEC
uniref:Uroplakin 3B n=1 Tax=Meleagris gallopavo TaxID=9103 RepID=G1MX02_MELGA